ncbi:MAG: hypothetical protein M9899_03315 [Bdellovibrionaceae bacterium]|nr:hypothetical protein [Pseudobdellovibrionaceae bacterium]
MSSSKMIRVIKAAARLAIHDFMPERPLSTKPSTRFGIQAVPHSGAPPLSEL